MSPLKRIINRGTLRLFPNWNQLYKPIINPNALYCSASPNLLPTSSSKKIKTIENAKILDKETFRVIFADENYCDFKNIWLRDSCKCEKCVDKTTRHKLFEISQVQDINFKINSHKIDPETGNLHIEWENKEGKHVSSYLSEWLYQFIPIYSKNLSGEKFQLTDLEYTSPAPPAQLWDRKLIEKRNLNVPFSEFMGTRNGLFSVLDNLNKYGIALIKDVPARQNEIIKAAERMGHVTQTGYGKTFQVKINPHPKTHLTYTGKKFEFHTDLSYMRNSPTLQLLHCIKAQTTDSNEKSAGGISFFADSFLAIEWLRNNHPRHFEILSKTPVVLAYLDAQRNRWFRTERSLITTNSAGRVTEFFCNEFSVRPPILPIDQIVPFYQAHHLLMKKINSEELMWKFFLKSGDLVVLDNTRVLHGRDEYDPTKIDRHLEGAYMDLQEVMSLYENMLEES